MVSWSLSKSTSQKWFPCMRSKKYTPAHPHTWPASKVWFIMMCFKNFDSFWPPPMASEWDIPRWCHFGRGSLAQYVGCWQLSVPHTGLRPYDPVNFGGHPGRFSKKRYIYIYIYDHSMYIHNVIYKYIMLSTFKSPGCALASLPLWDILLWVERTRESRGLRETGNIH